MTDVPEPARRLFLCAAGASTLTVLFALLALLNPAAAHAQDFDVRFAGGVIGRLSATTTAISTTLTNTPLGAADGWFRARRDGQTYSAANNEGRRIDVAFNGATVTAVSITPADERTNVSDPRAVPEGVLDPIAGFARIAQSKDCPGAFRMYDGRRIVEISTEARAVENNVLICRIAYRVTAGPGHLSPLYISNLSLTARYGLRDGQNMGLAQLDIGAGPFSAMLQRR